MDPIHQNAVLQAMVSNRVSATDTEKTFGPYFDPVHIQASSPELEHLDECYKPQAIRSCLASFLVLDGIGASAQNLVGAISFVYATANGETIDAEM